MHRQCLSLLMMDMPHIWLAGRPDLAKRCLPKAPGWLCPGTPAGKVQYESCAALQVSESQAQIAEGIAESTVPIKPSRHVRMYIKHMLFF